MSECLPRDPKQCTGDIATCEALGGECMECGARDCPHQDSAHYFHDGCPSCGGAYDNATPEEQASIDKIVEHVQKRIVEIKSGGPS